MLEGLVTWVLNNYLGKYVENLNTAQLSIALVSGKVELENLPLKKDALRHFGLPVQIRAGFIGKVKLQIPVSQIRSAPWVIEINQLYLVATPLPVLEWDAEAEATIAHEWKLSLLDEIEARWKLEIDSKEPSPTFYASSYSSWLSYGTGFITNIIENLQLKIKDVHIRYEDSISVTDKGVAFGLTMESLSAQSCDENWLPVFSHWDSSTFSYKLIEMQKLGMYWTETGQADMFAKIETIEKLAKVMVNNECANILAPVSAQARIQHSRSEQPLRSSTPRITCDLVMDDVPLTLVDWQYNQIVKCVNGLDDVARLRSYRQYRPDCPVHEDPRAWWLYAISSHFPENQPNICKPRPTWESCLQNAKDIVQYVNIYTKILITPTITLPLEESKLKYAVEWNKSFAELKVLRELAMRRVPNQSKSNSGTGTDGRSMLVRWFPQWWYSSQSPNSQSTEGATPSALEGEILQALNDSISNNSLLKRDAVFGKISFLLSSGTLCLSTTNNAKETVPMMELQFKNLSLNIVSRPRTSSHMIELSLGAVYLCDKFTENTLFPVLVGPPGQERSAPPSRSRGPSPRVSVANRPDGLDCLFYIAFEKKPEIGSGTSDYRLCIKSKSLDVVYQPAAVRWLAEFLCLPHQRNITQYHIEAMKSLTKKELMKNWEQILEGRGATRKSWDLQLDITAPQIFFVEQFNDPNAAIAVIDFGRLHLRNNEAQSDVLIAASPVDIKRDEEEETFMTPCSTPPASEESDSENTIKSLMDMLDENDFHKKLYDRYVVELTDMQIIIAKVKDNWRYAHNKGTSTLHVLDRFNISLQMERRVVHTYDPLYPSLTLNANLPKLVAHLNEQKIAAARKLAQIVTATGLPSPFYAPEANLTDAISSSTEEEDSRSHDTSADMSRLFMLQFTVDHLALEVQSRGRSVAELQVQGVKLGFVKRPVDVNVTLTVHSLLLVDALQTFGPDFELLVASHKHVGMDSMSGSIKDSEPTSPTSPGSPDCNVRHRATSPVALTKALTNLATSPPAIAPNLLPQGRLPHYLDSETLISLDLLLVFGADPIQIANIKFNNLDIIANQETIVELMGFIRRVFPELKSQKPAYAINQPTLPSSFHSSADSLSGNETPKMGTTEITFDFHRLNVLLLRGIVKEGFIVGKKICTATMSEAKIQATVNNGVTIEGSLGGLQVLDLTPEGHVHQRIVSVGRDPLLENLHPLYLMSINLNVNENKAFSFKILRSLKSSTSDNNDHAQITIRMASLWYTHSPLFLLELQSCATEFKQYLANLARSIRTAATDMALGLVHARAEALAQSIYMNSRLSTSIYGSALSFSDMASPRKRRRSSNMDQSSFSGYSSVRDTVPQTPYSPADDDNFRIDLNLDIVLDSPVVVLPRAHNSTQVFVAHLGKISMSNNKPYNSFNSYETQECRTEQYDIEIRDMNLFSLDTLERRVPGPIMSRPEILYCCDSLAKPMLHDTVVQLIIRREIPKKIHSRQHSLPNLLIDDDDPPAESKETTEGVEITGNVVSMLKVSLTRAQYEQLLDTIKWLTASPKSTNSYSEPKGNRTLTDISEEDTGVTTLNMDPHVRAKLFPAVVPKPVDERITVFVKVQFELPEFSIELRGDSPMGEQGLVNLSFRDFIFNYDKSHLYETNTQVSLRSIYMEDLLQPEDSKQRAMVISSSIDDVPVGSACVSRSCPDIYGYLKNHSPSHGSLPDHLDANRVLGMGRSNTVHVEPCSHGPMVCPSTPPPSPNARVRPVKNLVLITTLLVDPNAPNFKTHYKSLQGTTSVDFNCLDLVVNVESWVVVIDFFSASPTDHVDGFKADTATETVKDVQEDAETANNVETNISICSLTMTLVRPDRDVAKANISSVDVSIKTNGLWKEVEGRLGSMSLIDLTPHGQLYRERFFTSGKQALKFKYVRHGSHLIKEYDTQLTLNMASVFYVHTRRFVVEIQAFFNHFTQLQAIMAGIRAATSGKKMNEVDSRLSIVLDADSPVILLPVSSKSSQLIVVDLGELKLRNSFRYSGDPETISVISSTATARKCLLDVMFLDLQNVNLQAGVRESDSTTRGRTSSHQEYYRLGGCRIRRTGIPLLTEKCHLRIQVERNFDASVCHNVPDLSIHGELSTLDGTLDISQYTLIRGFLNHNLGENTEHILPSVQAPPVTAEPNIHDVWILSSIRLDLLNVTVRLQQCQKSTPLACINFIKSRLTIEGFSNNSQDIDLVSQEILIMDTRYAGVPHSKRDNVFTNILQPVKSFKQQNLVQVEVHSRKRLDRFKFTILLNNIRLMAVFDWWELAREFILQDIEEMPASPNRQRTMSTNEVKENVPFELKLNITDSEIVVVEDTSIWDTNAVILKSTTVVTYRSAMVEKPLSCNLNNCEMYSCILGMEDETALSIIDPVTLNIEINKDHVLDFQLQNLTVRLSYYDMKMFMQILNSLPKQMFAARQNDAQEAADVIQKQVDKLITLGFAEEDCMRALEICSHKLDDAALWLTQNAVPNQVQSDDDVLSVTAIEVKADNIYLCIIDDCGDADVPLLEVSLSKLFLHQGVQTKLVSDENPTKGALECILGCDYYNRVLSGWEPVLEPWKCLFMWEYTLTQNLSRNRLQITVESKETLNMNITSTFLELYKQVKDSWTQDLYLIKDKGQATTEYRSRSPFIPYALKNNTGSLITYSTLISEVGDAQNYDDRKAGDDSKWSTVVPGETVAFSFKSRDKIRHSDSHKMRMLQLGVRVEGFQYISPVTVDKVGVYFRNVAPYMQNRSQKDLPMGRVVFDVALDGSAKKLVTIRSALVLVNKMSEAVEVKLESQQQVHDQAAQWVPPLVLILIPGDSMAVPLTHVYSSIYVRPMQDSDTYTYCTTPINWDQSFKPGDISNNVRMCRSHRGKIYRFCWEIRRENYPPDRTTVGSMRMQAGHTITFIPNVLVVNLLPLDITYSISGVQGRICGGSEAALTFIDTDSPIEMNILLDNFPTSNVLTVPVGTTAITSRVRVEDQMGRKLYLNAYIAPHSDAKVKIVISAHFWIINKTGLPMVFKQGGAAGIAAGQFEEHELARMVEPLLFSFADHDASPTVVARVGTHVIPNGSAQWCQNFHLQNGVQVKKLRVTLKDGRPDVVFVVGIEVRQGRGKYRHTKIVTISPRFQLHNKSSYKLLFAQSCYAGNVNDNNSNIQYLKAMPDCHMPFHWPKLDHDPLLLSVLIEDIPGCCWSGGLKIDRNYSIHVNVRDANCRMYFLRLEVILQGATFFVIFSDADKMPPPIRVDNFSEVSIKFGQLCCRELINSTARAHSSVPYAWDESTKGLQLTLEAPGGVSHTYDISKLGTGMNLTYENFIYIAFTGTFKSRDRNSNPSDVETQELVLDVVGNRVVLSRKQQGSRSQLWRMTSKGELQHEGSSPPLFPNQLRTENILVLDIEGPAPQPSSYSRLALRRPDPRRKSTQTWRFTEDGRLCCAHHNMCVQAQDGFFGLTEGNAAVLGLPQPICHMVTDSGIPLEQAVSRQRMRPGSGILSVDVTTDGPTRVLNIRDLNEQKKEQLYATSSELDWSSIALQQRPNLRYRELEEKTVERERQFTLRLHAIGVSLVSRKPAQELLYAKFSSIVCETVVTPKLNSFCMSVKDVQMDNQLFDTSIPIFLYVTPISRTDNEIQAKLPALDVVVEMQSIVNQNAVIFNHFIVRMKRLTVNLEENLLLKLFEFVSYTTRDEELYKADENDYETQKMLTEVTAAHSTRYYFGFIQLVPDQIRLSMKTTNKLSRSQQQIKRKLGMPFITFEDAGVDLEPYMRQYTFETMQFLLHSIVKHFKDELKWQAGIILGSVDFLGNPMGFVNDVSEGFSGLIYEGNVGALVKNVTHGISNSAAKVTESLSDGLGKVSMDDDHEETRQRIRQLENGSSKAHLVAGIKGLGFGFLGGATGIFKQVYEGASNEGIPGIFSGIGKGIVGAVTKPVVGVLDMASETARAVRNSSRSSNRMLPERTRPPRCAIGPGGLLPRYSMKQSIGQQYLYTINDRRYAEQLVAYESLGSSSDDLRIIISNFGVRIVTSPTTSTLTSVIESSLSDLKKCRIIQEPESGEMRYYIELTLNATKTSANLVYQDSVKKPKVRCDSYEVARAVQRQINYAKRLFDERRQTLLSSDNISQSED